MNDETANLNRLHDIVLPADIPWWPLAPGWYILAAIILVLALVFAYRARSRWQAGAYRREALRALESASDTAAVIALLRRTALAESPRREIASLNENTWIDWLNARSARPIPPELREQLTLGAYRAHAATDPTALRSWAAEWISTHQAPRENP